MNVVLVSTYELGRQPFGLASPQAWLVREGHQVTCLDLAVEPFREPPIRDAGMVGFYLPMHTATRLALPVVERVRNLNPRARLVGYGLYAPLNAELLRGSGVESIVGGEFEAALVALARGESLPAISAIGMSAAPPSSAGLMNAPSEGVGIVRSQVNLDRLQFITPDRKNLPDASQYAHLRQGGESRQVAYTEASRGCKHLCRHCPVVPIYQGQFRIVQQDVVLGDIRQQVAAGARHVTFGDPDFFNGPSHARRIVEALHAEFPDVTYDVTIKIEHLLKHRDLLATLRETRCLFVISAVEAVDDHILAKLEKNHTRRDFMEAVARVRDAGLTLQPTFIAFTPWTTLAGYRDLLHVIADLELVESVAPVQLALRLLITPGSRLLELESVRALARPFDRQMLIHPWTHPDPRVDALAHRVFQLVQEWQRQGRGRREIFEQVWNIAGDDPLPENFRLLPRAAIPYLDEPWYC
jgi:radical SAM superfamily enzyme YgiQ (UPF0313 family)